MMNALRAEEVSVVSFDALSYRVATSLLVLGIAAMLGCAGKRDTENNVLRLRLEEGGSVGARLEEAARPGQVAAILVYDASMCFACSPYLTRWEELSRKKQVPLILLLREPPSPSERRAIRLQRVPVVGVIQRRTTWPPSPSEYLVRSGRIIATAEGELEVRRKRLWEHPLVEDSALGSGKVAARLSRVLVPEFVLAKGR